MMKVTAHVEGYNAAFTDGEEYAAFELYVQDRDGDTISSYELVIIDNYGDAIQESLALSFYGISFSY